MEIFYRGGDEMKDEEAGYMLVEMLISLMIFGLLCMGAIALYNHDFYEKRQLAMETNAVAYDLRRYQQAARYGSHASGKVLYMDKTRYGLVNNGNFEELVTYPTFMEAKRKSYIYFSSTGRVARFSGVNPYTIIYKFKDKKWESRVIVALITGRIRVEHGGKY